MTTYTLNIDIDKAGLDILTEASQQICIVKQTTPTSNPVIWVTFHPELTNSVTWTEDYLVYGSSTSIQSGATIETNSVLPASGGDTYTFENGQFDENGKPGNSAVQYGVDNQDDNFNPLTAGLAQVNSQTAGETIPINATEVPFNNTGVYTPIEKVQVFAMAEVNNALVLSSVTGDALLVDLTEQPNQTIHYQDSDNTFQPGSLS